MAVAEEHSTDELQRALETEREQLAEAVGSLRDELKPPLPVAAAIAFLAGFVLAGGIGATMRLLFRRGREG
jgi:hypothetical protein